MGVRRTRQDGRRLSSRGLYVRSSGRLGELPTRADSRWFWNHYLDDELDGDTRTPRRCGRGTSGLPPASVLTCGFDPLRDEGVAYASRLAEAGVSVRHHHLPDQIHGFVGMFVEPMRSHAEDALATMLDDLSG